MLNLKQKNLTYHSQVFLFLSSYALLIVIVIVRSTTTIA